MHTLDHAISQGMTEEEYIRMMRQQQMGASQQAGPGLVPPVVNLPEAYGLPQTELVAQQPDVIGSLPSTNTPIVDSGATMTDDQLMASLLQPDSFQTDMQTLADQSALANALRTMSADDLAFT
jgi:hypothetical protein